MKIYELEYYLLQRQNPWDGESAENNAVAIHTDLVYIDTCGFDISVPVYDVEEVMHKGNMYYKDSWCNVSCDLVVVHRSPHGIVIFATW